MKTKIKSRILSVMLAVTMVVTMIAPTVSATGEKQVTAIVTSLATTASADPGANEIKIQAALPNLDSLDVTVNSLTEAITGATWENESVVGRVHTFNLKLPITHAFSGMSVPQCVVTTGEMVVNTIIPLTKTEYDVTVGTSKDDVISQFPINVSCTVNGNDFVESNIPVEWLDTDSYDPSSVVGSTYTFTAQYDPLIFNVSQVVVMPTIEVTVNAATAETFTVTGTITDSVNASTKIAGAVVTLTGDDATYTSNTTGGDGAYSVDVPNGSYTAKITASGYVNGTISSFLVDGDVVKNATLVKGENPTDPTGPGLTEPGINIDAGTGEASIVPDGNSGKVSVSAADMATILSGSDPVIYVIADNTTSIKIPQVTIPTGKELIVASNDGNTTYVWFIHGGSTTSATLDLGLTTTSSSGIYVSNSSINSTNSRVINFTNSGNLLANGGKIALVLSDVPDLSSAIDQNVYLHKISGNTIGGYEPIIGNFDQSGFIYFEISSCSSYVLSPTPYTGSYYPSYDWDYGYGYDYDSSMTTVYFDEMGGTSVEDVFAQVGSYAKIPTDPTKSGFTFAGWYLDSSFTESLDIQSDSTFFVSSDLKGDTVYAKWIPRNVTPVVIAQPIITSPPISTEVPQTGDIWYENLL